MTKWRGSMSLQWLEKPFELAGLSWRQLLQPGGFRPSPETAHLMEQLWFGRAINSSLFLAGPFPTAQAPRIPCHFFYSFLGKLGKRGVLMM